MVTTRSKRRKAQVGHARRRGSHPSRKVLGILRRMKTHLQELYGDGILKVIVYGSQARGDAHEGSDVDVAIVIKDSLDPRAVEASLDDLLWHVVVDEGELVAAIAFRETPFEDAEYSLIRNIKAEGVAV